MIWNLFCPLPINELKNKERFPINFFMMKTIKVALRILHGFGIRKVTSLSLFHSCYQTCAVSSFLGSQEIQDPDFLNLPSLRTDTNIQSFRTPYNQHHTLKIQNSTSPNLPRTHIQPSLSRNT